MSTLETVVRRLRELKDEKEKLGEEEKRINIEISQIETLKLPEMMESAGITSFKVPGIGSVSIRNETYVSVLAENRPQLYAELRASGNGDLITEQVNPQTLKSWVKENLEAGNEVPDVVKVTYVKEAKLRRS